MGDDRVERRAVLGAGLGVLASLAGCSGLFIEPETTATPGGGEESTPTPAPTATPTPTPAPTATGTPAPTPTATAAPLPSEHVEVRNRRLAVRRSRLEAFGLVTYRFDVENASERTIADIEFRVRIRYEHEEFSRIVATAYPRFVFDDGGLDAGGTAPTLGEVRFERDGRAEGSTAVNRFDLELSIRRIRFA